MSILLQLEVALADARASLERAAETLHDTGVAHALAKSQYDAANDVVKRVEGALNSMHGVGTAPVQTVGSSEQVPTKRHKPKEPEGPACPSCGEVGKLSYTMKGTMKFIVCSACNAEIPQ